MQSSWTVGGLLNSAFELLKCAFEQLKRAVGESTSSPTAVDELCIWRVVRVVGELVDSPTARLSRSTALLSGSNALLASPRALLLSARTALHFNVNTLTAQSTFIFFHESRRTARELCCSRMNLFILEQQSSRAFVHLKKINTVYHRYFHIWEFKY